MPVVEDLDLPDLHGRELRGDGEPAEELGQPGAGGDHHGADPVVAGRVVHEQPVGHRLDPGDRRVLAELGTTADGEVEQGGHGEVGVQVAGVGVEAGVAVEGDPRPAFGDGCRRQQAGLDALGPQGGVHLLLAAGARIETTRLGAQGHPRLVLEPLPLLAGAAGEGDVERVGVGTAVDPRGAVRAAAVVADGVLLEQEHGVAPRRSSRAAAAPVSPAPMTATS